MEAITGVLQILKVNNTLWIQLACFMVSYLALSQLIFKPYYAAYKKRHESTVGGEELAAQVIEETTVLQEEYEAKAKKINLEFKEIYDQKKGEATKEYENLVSAARTEAGELQQKVRDQVAQEVDQAENELNKEVPSVSLAMASKLIGKEISQ